MGFRALAFLLFLLICQAQGDVKEETLYVKTGTDLLLDVGEPVTLKEHEFMFWNFNSILTIVRLTDKNKIVTSPDYAGRAELFRQNQTLLLKNVQKTDSGEYTALSTGFTDTILAQYQIRVLDPVSDVKLEVKQCGSDRSDRMVTCTTLDGLLTFICGDTTFYHEGGELTLNIPSGASMKVYLKNGSVTCHHSNQVSSKEDTKTVEDLCVKDPVNSACKDDASKIYISIIVVMVVVFGAITCLLWCRKRFRR